MKRGTVYLRGDTYWVQYYRAGVPYRESTHTDKKRKAELLLQQRLAEVTTGNFSGPRIEKIFVSELAEDLLREYETGVIKGQKSIEWAERRWNLHLQPFFGHLRAVQVGSDLLSRYVEHRQEQDAANATINRELAFLRRAYQRGLHASPRKVTQIPSFPRLPESSPRQGFLRDEQYEILAEECSKTGLWLRAILAVGCNFCWRKGEVINLRVRQVDILARTIRLESGTTKNGEGRVVRMTDEVQALLTECLRGKSSDDFVFTRENGQRIKDFRKSWRNACDNAGVPDLLFHDLRRTGNRNLRRLGVSETVIMKIGGWKTANVFRRYDITDEADLADAARRLDEKREQMRAQNQHKTATIPPMATELEEAVLVGNTLQAVV